MKKKILSGVFALALLATAGWGVNKSMNSHVDLNDLALRNVLALADVENPDPGEGGGDDQPWNCETYDKYSSSEVSFGACNNEYYDYVAVLHVVRGCNNGEISFCYPGTITTYFDPCGSEIGRNDQTVVSTCSGSYIP